MPLDKIGGYWISDHKADGGYFFDPHNTGTGKSLCMDLSHRGINGLGDGLNWGPNSFGVYFGDGARTGGYGEMYFFFMVRIPRKEYPVYEHAVGELPNVGEYVEGQPYIWNASWKFIEFMHGFVAPWQHADAPNTTYGWHAFVLHAKPKDDISFNPHFTYDQNDYLATDNASAACRLESLGRISKQSSVDIPVDKWIGIEVYARLNTDGQQNGLSKIWYYDEDGTEHVVAEYSDIFYQASCLAGDKFNKVALGSNNSNTWLWGDTMEPRYYIDDFIINGTRIGPAYFMKKLSAPGQSNAPAAPANLRIID